MNKNIDDVYMLILLITYTLVHIVTDVCLVIIFKKLQD